MKKPIFIMANDIHIAMNNVTILRPILANLVIEAVKNGVDIVLAGDVFDSRSSQRLSVLDLFDEFLGMCESNAVTCFVIPGNHDKTLYSSHNSFLKVFRYHPSCVLIEDIKDMVVQDVNVTFMPFFDEDMMVKRLNEHSGGQILVSHFELNGSVNNGIVSKGRAISKSMLDKWDLVLLGHYHNYHKVTDKVSHCPSIIQKNFGEDENKGYTLVYNDLTYEIIKSDFKPFKTIKINIDEITPKLSKEWLKLAESNVNLRIEVSGATEKLKSFKKVKYSQAGIDIKLNHDELTLSEKGFSDVSEVKGLDRDSVKERFDKFCDEDELDKERGKKYLEKCLKGVRYGK